MLGLACDARETCLCMQVLQAVANIAHPYLQYQVAATLLEEVFRPASGAAHCAAALVAARRLPLALFQRAHPTPACSLVVTSSALCKLPLLLLAFGMPG